MSNRLPRRGRAIRYAKSLPCGIAATDAFAYADYRAYCHRLDVHPLPFARWCEITGHIPERWGEIVAA